MVFVLQFRDVRQKRFSGEGAVTTIRQIGNGSAIGSVAQDRKRSYGALGCPVAVQAKVADVIAFWQALRSLLRMEQPSPLKQFKSVIVYWASTNQLNR
jgi:hypothetical protein